MADAGQNERPHGYAERAAELTPEYFATLLHEIRNPLAPIRNAAELLHSLCVDSRQLQAVDIIERQVVNLTHMLDDLTEAASARRSPVAIASQTIEIADIAGPAIRAVRASVDRKRQNLLVSLPPETVQMKCDPVRLSQVLQTLLDNATRHTPEGGSIALKITAGVDALTIEVSDNGVGIAPERLPVVFNVFTDRDRSQSQASGYNLAISRNIIELHGGVITAESGGIGRGSRFVARLPLQCAEAYEPTEAAPGASRRVLIVDDHADSAQSLAQVLASGGHSVLTAATGELAVELALRFKPEAVIIDIGLPGMDGFDVAARLRKHPATAHALLIAVSGYSLKTFRDIESYSVFRHYLLKPTSPYTIMYIIEHTQDASS